MARAAARLRAQLPHAGRAESRTAPRCRHRHQPSAGHLAGRGRGGAGRGAIFSADTALTPDTTTWPGPGACLVRPRQVRGQTRGHKAARRQVAGGRSQVAGVWRTVAAGRGWRHCSCRQSCPAPAPAPSVCDHLVSGGDLARLQAAPRQQGGHHEYRISNRTETPIQYFVCFH